MSSITYWNRLEPRPRSRNLNDTLAARLRDPLWLLCRQWQFGEFNGEDAGSPAFATIRGASEPVTAFHGRTPEWQPLDGRRPLESLVLAEPFASDDLSLQVELALAFARSLGEPVYAFATIEVELSGVDTLHVAEGDGFESYAPAATAQALTELVDRLSPGVVVAAGSERGNEVLARLAAKRELPFAANCIAAGQGDPMPVTRVRWGGSLLEEALLHGAPKLLTVQPGLGGVWQVCGRSETTYEERVEMDMAYIDHRCAALDAELLWRTVGAVITARGAC